MSFYLCFLALYSLKLSEYSVYCYAAIGVINDQWLQINSNVFRL